MAERIRDRLMGLANVQDADELRQLWNALLVDLTLVKSERASILADITEIRTKLAAGIVDLPAIRTPLAATVTDVAAIRTRSLTGMQSKAGLVIGTASALVPKASLPFVALANGTLVFKPADTAMSALVGTIAQSKYGLWAFYIDSAGTITTSTLTADADTAAAAFLLMPAAPASKAQIGFIIVTNSGEAFDGGTDALNKASTTVIYVDTVGHLTAPVALTASAPAALTATAPAALTATTPATLTLQA